MCTGNGTLLVMEERRYLHDAERVLCALRPSTAWLGVGFVLCTGYAVLISVPFFVVLNVALAGSGLQPLSFIFLLLFFVVVHCSVFLRCFFLWKTSSFRVTTDRMLLQLPGVLFRPSLRTIKWAQYQESRTRRGNILDMVFRARSLCVRYGSDDGDRLCFPSLLHTKDLKHYLDKVDSAVKTGMVAGLKQFVLKRQGERW